MTPWTLLFLALLAGTPVSDDCLKVMTFNIRYGTAPDGSNGWTARRDLLKDVIHDSSPDILGLQEALRFQIDELLQAFPEYAGVGVGRDDGKTQGEYSSILYRRSRLTLLSDSTFWFSDTPEIPGSASWGNRIPRICTWASFSTRSDTLAVFNVHLDHESQRSREYSASLLMKTVEQTANGIPVIVMGDFNAGEDNPSVLTVRHHLQDSFRVVHPNETAVGTFHAFTGDSTGEKIDHIFVNSFFAVAGASIVRTHAHGRYPSDHFPVTATICLSDHP